MHQCMLPCQRIFHDPVIGIHPRFGCCVRTPVDYDFWSANSLDVRVLPVGYMYTIKYM